MAEQLSFSDQATAVAKDIEEAVKAQKRAIASYRKFVGDFKKIREAYHAGFGKPTKSSMLKLGKAWLPEVLKLLGYGGAATGLTAYWDVISKFIGG